MLRVGFVWGVSLLIVSSARADYERLFVVLSGQTSSAVTYELAKKEMGYLPSTSGGSTYCIAGTFSTGVDSSGVRDGLVPESGLAGGFFPSSECASPNNNTPIAKRARINGIPGIEIQSSPSNSQLWVRATNGAWNLLEPNALVTVAGVSFTAVEPGLGVGSAAGTIPAVGGVGLVVLVAVLLGVGAFIIVKRRQASAT